MRQDDNILIREGGVFTAICKFACIDSSSTLKYIELGDIFVILDVEPSGSLIYVLHPSIGMCRTPADFIRAYCSNCSKHDAIATSDVK